MHVHILGICGTFMGGIALLARALGHCVTGQDANVYPPMSTQLEAAGIQLAEGYDPADIPAEADVVVIGNAMSRGNPAVEHVLDRGLAYTSGPQWLADHVLAGRWVLGVAGTHGKTTTSSMLAWILEAAGLAPGFLIGGVPNDFGVSARLGDTPFFVVEADEYDTAFFDKRSKFVHYRPRTVVLNNLEFDHADIFPDLQAIQRQFHHLVRTVPSSGLIVVPEGETAVDEVLAMGLWTPVESVGDGADWSARLLSPDGSRFEVLLRGESAATVEWSLLGRHNVANGLAAIAAARHTGVPVSASTEALGSFQGVKRRLEIRGRVGGITVYDDFAHHPSAIALTLDGLRRHAKSGRIVAVLEPRSNTMRLGVHSAALGPSLADADAVFLYAPPDIGWDVAQVGTEMGDRFALCHDMDTLVDAVCAAVEPGDHVLVMSNGAFGGVHDRLLNRLAEKSTEG